MSGCRTVLVVALLAVSVLVAPLSTASSTPEEAQAWLETGHDCLIEPMVIAELGSSVRGIVSRIRVERGQRVKRGQTLVELDASVERAGLEEAEARADTQGETQAREAELNFARQDFIRFEDMHAQRLAPAQQRDEALANRQVAGAALVQALENRRLSQLELLRIRREVERRAISSPIDGVVADVPVTLGELVIDDPVVRVVQLDPLRVEAVLPGRLFGTFSPEDEALVRAEYDDGLVRRATIELVDPVLDAGSGTFRVRLLLPNPEHAIVAGQQCRVRFDVPTEPGSAEEPPMAAAEQDVQPDHEADLDAGEQTIEKAVGGPVRGIGLPDPQARP